MVQISRKKWIDEKGVILPFGHPVYYLCELTCLPCLTFSDPFVIFTGGMPRASYGDRHTISVMQGPSSSVVFDFTTKVIDFVVLTRGDENDVETEDNEQRDGKLTVIAQ